MKKMTLEERLNKFLLETFGEPIAVIREKFNERFNGEVIGGSCRIGYMTYDPKSRSAVFRVSDGTDSAVVCVG